MFRFSSLGYAACLAPVLAFRRIVVSQDRRHAKRSRSAPRRPTPPLASLDHALEAIQQYVEREEARESFKHEALASWAAYQETGRHLTGQEVRTWLNAWGTEDEKTVPECHK